LLELLLVIAIIAVLAGIIMFALNPADRLNSANNVKAVANAKDFEKALKAYTLDNEGNVPSGFSAKTQSGVYDICKYGETIGCINLDNLTSSGYIGNIPVDTRNATTYTTGYKVDYNATNKDIKIYTQEDYERVTKYCPPGDNCSIPLAEWSFNEGTGQIIHDVSANSNGGILGSTLEIDSSDPIFENGVEGSMLSFDGIDDYVRISSAANLNIAGTITIQAWIKPSLDLLNAQTIVAKNTSSSSGYWFLYNWTSYATKKIQFMGVNNDVASSATNVEPGIWTHVVVIREGTNVTFYINGLYDVTRSIGGSINPISNNPLIIGARSELTGYRFKGSIDQVSIYNYARTPAQITWDYNQGAPMGYWKFDHNEGTIAEDSSENEMDGTLINNPTWSLGKYSNALNFDNINEYVDLGNHSKLSITGELSISAWIKPTGLSTQEIIGRQHFNNEYAFGITGSEIYFLFGNAGNTWQSIGANIQPGIWQQVVVVRRTSPKVQEFYVNGKYISQNIYTNTVLATASNTIIGRRDAFNYPFSGLIDEIKIYNYALTPSQIMQDMRGI